ncbi:MAG: SPFH domain-containing protein [Oscillospiraceae bacterium]|nr:SPFH domain-containing protein [Oscillospiraceae bacterium]
MSGIIQVIEYEGDNSTFVWKHHIEDFNYGTQLIVHESQEAVFFKDGKALDLFKPDRYTLKTQNIPLLRKVVESVAGGNSPFHCEIYFINKTEQMGIPWGMSSKINYADPHYNGYPFPIGASGSMNLRIVDSRKLLVKVVGTAQSLSQLTLKGFLNAPLQTKIKTFLSTILSEKKPDIYDIQKLQEELSLEMQKRLSDEFEDYGVEISKFWIENLVTPDEDPVYCQIKKLKGDVITRPWEANIQSSVELINAETNKQIKIKEAEGLKESRDIQGINFKIEEGAKIALALAQNEGVGNFSNAGIGLGMMAGMAGPISGVANHYVDAFLGEDTTVETDKTQYDMPEMIELKEEESFADSSKEVAEIDIRLAKLEKLKGKISEEQYNAKMQEILDSI